MFDEKLKEGFLLKPSCPEDHGVWKDFQPKFDHTFNLYNYEKFFKEMLLKTSVRYIKELVTIVEYRHIFGCVFDDDGPIGLEREMQIFKDV